jgi:hypothetical protein
MSSNQDSPKLENPDVLEAGNDGGEASNESQQTDFTGVEGTKSDKQKSTILKYTFLLSLMSICISLTSVNNFSYLKCVI